MPQTVIYGCRDSCTNELRYVGKTSLPIQQRLRDHIRDKGKSHRVNWFKKCEAEGNRPEIFVLEIVEDDWRDAERFWISYALFLGCRLVNAVPGGEGGSLGGTFGFRRGISSWNKGKSPSLETRSKISATLTGRKTGPLTDAHKEKVRRGRLGKKQPKSPESMARWKESMRKRYKGGWSPNQKGSTWSESHRRNFEETMRRKRENAKSVDPSD